MHTIPIVFLHGFLGHPRDWDPVCAHLLEFHCKPLCMPFIYPNVPKMHLVGYSMGGRIAMQYALAFPEKIATLTILSAHRGIYDPQEKQKRFEADVVWAQKITKSFDDFLLEWYDQPIFAGFKPDLTTRRNQDPEKLAKILLEHSLGKQDVLQPKNALFVVGERDEKYRKLYPDAVVVPNAGHMVHLEQPEVVANIIRKRVFTYDI